MNLDVEDIVKQLGDLQEQSGQVNERLSFRGRGRGREHIQRRNGRPSSDIDGDVSASVQHRGGRPLQARNGGVARPAPSNQRGEADAPPDDARRFMFGDWRVGRKRTLDERLGPSKDVNTSSEAPDSREPRARQHGNPPSSTDLDDLRPAKRPREALSDGEMRPWPSSFPTNERLPPLPRPAAHNARKSAGRREDFEHAARLADSTHRHARGDRPEAIPCDAAERGHDSDRPRPGFWNDRRRDDSERAADGFRGSAPHRRRAQEQGGAQEDFSQDMDAEAVPGLPELPAIPIAKRPAPRRAEQEPGVLKRNRRMLGALLGHLAGHRQQVDKEQNSAAALKRQELEESAKKKEAEQARQLRELARQRAIEQRLQDIALKRQLVLQQHQKQAELMCAKRIAREREQLKFVKTKTWPPLLWEPAAICNEVEALLDDRGAQFVLWIETREALLKSELAAMAEGAARRWAQMDQARDQRRAAANGTARERFHHPDSHGRYSADAGAATSGELRDGIDGREAERHCAESTRRPARYDADHDERRGGDASRDAGPRDADRGHDEHPRRPQRARWADGDHHEDVRGDEDEEGAGLGRRGDDVSARGEHASEEGDEAPGGEDAGLRDDDSDALSLGDEEHDMYANADERGGSVSEDDDIADQRKRMRAHGARAARGDDF